MWALADSNQQSVSRQSDKLTFYMLLGSPPNQISQSLPIKEIWLKLFCFVCWRKRVMIIITSPCSPKEPSWDLIITDCAISWVEIFSQFMRSSGQLIGQLLSSRERRVHKTGTDSTRTTWWETGSPGSLLYLYPGVSESVSDFFIIWKITPQPQVNLGW